MYAIREDYNHRNRRKTYSDSELRTYWSNFRLDSSRYYQYYVYKKAKSIFNAKKYTSVVDVGCGSGFKLNHFFIDAPRVVGIDQKQATQWASERWSKNITFIAADIEDYTHTAEKFDLVLCSDVIEHVDNPDKVLNLLKSLVAPGGIILLSTPDRAVLYGGDCLEPGNSEHVREWTYSEFSDYLHGAELLIKESGHQPAIAIRLNKLFISMLRTIGLRKIWHCMYFVCSTQKNELLA